jgi:hypothetical protein
MGGVILFQLDFSFRKERALPAKILSVRRAESMRKRIVAHWRLPLVHDLLVTPRNINPK